MNEVQSEPILFRKKQNNIEIITMNNPKKLNALSNQMLSELQYTLDEISKDNSIKVVIIKGNGKVFCAGHDLKEMISSQTSDDDGKKSMIDLFSRCSRLMLSIRNMPQPVIAQVHGLATAAGCQLVASCDMAVAGKQTKFGVNGVNIGLFCSTPMVALSRNIPRKLTFEMLTTGEFIDAKKACAIGLINRIASEEKLASETLKLAQVVSEKLSAVVKIGKEAFYNQLEMQVEEAYSYTGKVMAENMGLKDTQEGILAFLEKRTPKWNT